MHVTKNGIFTQSVLVSKQERGFTLPEIVIALVIISVLVAIAVPASIQSMRAYRLETAVSVLNEKLMETRIDAIKRNRTSWLTIDKTAKKTQVNTTDSAGTTITVGYAQMLPQGVNLSGTANSINVTFNSLGQSPSGTQTFTIIESGSTLRKDITVSPAGKITVSGMYIVAG